MKIIIEVCIDQHLVKHVFDKIKGKNLEDCKKPYELCHLVPALSLCKMGLVRFLGQFIQKPKQF